MFCPFVLILLPYRYSSFLCYSFVTGRAPNTKRLNLEAAGVELDKTGAVKVSSFSVIQLVLSIELHVITLVRKKQMPISALL
jgi:hypothetical protein